MAREMGLAERTNMSATALIGHGPGVTITEDESLSNVVSFFGPSFNNAVKAKGDSSMRTIISPTLAERSEEITNFLERTLITHTENIDDWVNAIFPRKAMESEGYNFEWTTDEINAHVALPSPEGHAFHIMTSATEKRTASMGRYSIGMRAHNDDLKESAGRTRVAQMLGNITSTIIRAERQMALAHISRVPGLVKFLVQPQGVKTYASIQEALTDSVRYVGALGSPKAIYRIWNEIKLIQHFAHVIVPKGLPEKLIEITDWETSYWQTGRPAHRAFKDPARQIAAGLSEKPIFWVLEPMPNRDITSKMIEPLKRLLRFGDQTQIDGTHLIREPHDVSVRNHLTVQIVDGRKDDWTTIQYFDALRHTGRWDLRHRDGQGPLDPKHYDFSTRGFAHYVNINANNYYRKPPIQEPANEPQPADLWGDTYFWRVGSYGSMTKTESVDPTRRLFMPCERWGDQDLIYRTLEFDEQHTRRALSSLKLNFSEADYAALNEWDRLADELSNPSNAGSARDFVISYVERFASQDGRVALMTPEETAELNRKASFEDKLTYMQDLQETKEALVFIKEPYGFGTAWGMYIMADASRLSRHFEGWGNHEAFIRAHEIAAAAWKSVKKVFDFSMKCYPASKKFLSSNALYWFNVDVSGSVSGSDAMQIQFWELMASDNAHLPTFVTNTIAQEPQEMVTDEDSSVLKSLERFKTDEVLKRKLLFAASRTGKDFYAAMKIFINGERGMTNTHVQNLDEISRHTFFNHTVTGKYFTEIGELTREANDKVEVLTKKYVDFKPEDAFGGNRSDLVDDAKMDKVAEDLHRAFLTILIMEGEFELESQLPKHSKDLARFYEGYVESSMQASSGMRKKRARSESISKQAADPAAAYQSKKATPISFSVAWWRGQSDVELDGRISVGLPVDPMRPYSEAADAPRPRLIDARGRPMFEHSEDDVNKRKLRVFGEALRRRERDTLPLGDRYMPNTDWETLEEMRDIYHYHHLIFNAENGVFWRRDARPEYSANYYEVGPMSMRMQFARRQFGDSSITLALARSFLLSDVTYRSIESIVRCNGLPPVLSLLLLRPFAEVHTQAVIFANEAGNLLSKHADLMEGSDVESKTWSWHYTEWKGILQKNYSAIMIRPDLIFDGYRRGMNSNFFPTEWTLDGTRTQRMKDDSLFVADCGANFSREDLLASANPVSVTGRYVPARFADVRLSSEENDRLSNPSQPHFPGYAWLHFQHHLHFLENGQGPMSEYTTFEHLRDNSWFDGLCWRGTQRVWNDATRGYTTKISGNGVARDWDAPGIVDRLAGNTAFNFE